MALAREQITIVDLHDGVDGSSYSLNILGGTRTISYNATGKSPTPAQTAYSCELYKDGVKVTPSSYAWSASGHLSGTSTAAGFTPTAVQTYNASLTSSNVVSLTVAYGGMAFKGTVQVVVTKAATDAKLITLVANSQVFKVVGETVSPTTTKITAETQNTSVTAWTYSSNGAAFTGTLPAGVTRSGSTVTITGASMTAQTIAVKASDGTYSDVMTIVKVADGKEGKSGAPAVQPITGFLTNESVTFPADFNGNVTGHTGPLGSFKVFQGTTDVTASADFTASNNVGGAVSISDTGVYTLNSLTADRASVDLKAVYGGVSIVKTLTISKSRAGAPGRAVDKVDVMYYSSTSSTTQVNGSWSTNAPDWVNGRFIWSKTVTTYSEGTPATTSSLPILLTGATGNTGRGVKSITEQYALTSNKNTAPSQGSSLWKDVAPTWTKGNYMWTRSKIVYLNSDGSETTAYVGVTVDTAWEAANDALEDAKEYTDESKSKNYGYRYKEDVIVYGDSSKYYPVIIKGGNQDIKRDILVTRGYSELAPPDWNTPTHKGGLTLKIKTNFGGWGGANYSWEIHELEEMYSKTFAGAQNVMSQMAFAIFLRGGGATGAIYHLYSDQPLVDCRYSGGTTGIPCSPQVGLAGELIGKSGQYEWTAPPARDYTPAVIEEIRKRNFIKMTQSHDVRIDVNEKDIALRATKTEVNSINTRLKAAELKVTPEEITSTVRGSTEYINDQGKKVSSDEIISKINQTSEQITIDAKKINIKGAVEFSSFDTALQNNLNKRARTFTSTPVPPYSLGDIWKNSTSTYMCKVARASGSYVASDWEKTGDVTSANKAADTSKVGGTAAATVVTGATAGSAAKTATDRWTFTGKTTINGGQIEADTVTAAQIKAKTITASEIAAKTITVDQLASSVGGSLDLSSNTAITSRVTSTQLSTALSGKEDSIFKQNSAPAHKVGGLWLDTSTDPNQLKRSDGTKWVIVNDTTDLEDAIGDVSQAVTDLDDHVNNAFHDGVISEVEARTIEKYLNIVNTEKADVDAKYTKLYANPLLAGTAKTGLYSVRSTYNTAHTNLISAINTAIRGGSATNAEKTNVDAKFTAYRTALTNLSTAFEVASAYLVDAVNGRFDGPTGVLKRLNEAESKVTDDAIIGTVSQRTTSDGKPLFAKTSEVKQTVDNWTAKFSQIGGTNLLYASNVPASASSYSITSYKMEEEWLPNTEYTVTVKGTLKGTGTREWGVWASGSSTRVGTSGAHSSGETSFTFTTPSSISISAPKTLQLYNYPSSGAGASTVEWIKLEKGAISTGYDQHPSELYTGITTINKDGVTVGREGETIETNLGFDGIEIKDGTTPIASFTGSGANIKNLEAESINGDVINIMSSSMTFNVGSVSGYYADFSEVLRAIGNRKHLANGVKLTINIRSVLNETIFIEGFSGSGVVELNIYSRVNGNIETRSNSCFISIQGKNTTHVVNGSGNAISCSSSVYVALGGLNINSNNTTSGKGIVSQQGSNVYIDSCDIINAQDALYAMTAGKLQALNTKGNVTRFAAMASSGRIWLRGTVPDGGNYGFTYNFEAITRTPSSFSPPATTTGPETRTFNHTDIYTYSVKYSAKSSHYGKAAAQNRWDTSMTQMKGRIVFGSSVYSFIAGRNSGTTPTVKIRLRRQNSSHGASASVKPTPEWSGAPSFGGATIGNWTPWVTIPYTLFTSSGYTFSFYNGTTGNTYAIWDRAEVQITRTITQ